MPAHQHGSRSALGVAAPVRRLSGGALYWRETVNQSNCARLSWYIHASTGEAPTMPDHIGYVTQQGTPKLISAHFQHEPS